MHVAIVQLVYLRSSNSLTKDRIITYHLFLINLYFHFSSKQTDHSLATLRREAP